MNSQETVRSVALVLALIGLALPTLAEEMVTIPKSRLQELERKEAELDKLKGVSTKPKELNPPPSEEELKKLKTELSRTQEQNAELQKQHAADAAKIAATPAAEPVVTHASPPMASLPPLAEGETVDAMDLANHYRADAAAADERYRGKTFLVRGEVVRFEKPMFVRDYKIVLKTADRELKVVCNVFPPEQYKAVFPAKDGSELIGLTSSEARMPITKVGDTVVVGGQCKGLRNSTVTMAGCELKAQR